MILISNLTIITTAITAMVGPSLRVCLKRHTLFFIYLGFMIFIVVSKLRAAGTSSYFAYFCSPPASNVC